MYNIYIQLYMYIVYLAVPMLVICSKHENNVLIFFSFLCSACIFVSLCSVKKMFRRKHQSVLK